jgi:hypothetical protein
MKAKGKATKENRSEAARFLWHFEPKLRELFDHNHWWLEKKPHGKPEVQIPCEAVLWEFFRRHPDLIGFGSMSRAQKLAFSLNFGMAKSGLTTARDLELQADREHELTRQKLLTRFAHLSWPRFTEAPRELWQLYLEEKFPPQHGINLGEVVVLNPNRLKALVLDKRAKTSSADRLAAFRFRAVGHLLENAIHLAETADKKGHMLISIDPSAPLASITEKIKAHVRTWKQQLQISKQEKNYISSSLDVVAKFERHELERDGAKKRDDQLFAMYRRAIKGWTWSF